MGREKGQCTKAWKQYAATLSPLERLPPQYEAALHAFYRAYDVGANDMMDFFQTELKAKNLL